MYPDKPILRYTLRGLVAGAATVAAPVAVVGAAALLAVGTTIGAPTYGTYRLVKHIRKKQRARRLGASSAPSHMGEDTSSNTDDDDFHRAVEASLQTYNEEQQRREKLMKENSEETVDDNDDSFFGTVRFDQ